MYCEEIRPYWILVTKGYGFTVDDIDWSSPTDLEPYSKSYNLQLQQQDYMSWLHNQYTLSAVLVAVEHCLAGKKAKSEYIKKPILSKEYKDAETEEQIEKDIQKAILTEQQYMAMAINKELPETIIV